MQLDQYGHPLRATPAHIHRRIEPSKTQRAYTLVLSAQSSDVLNVHGI